MKEEKKNRIIITCYIIIIMSAIYSIGLIVLLLQSAGYNRNLSEKYDFLLRFLACILFLGIVVPPFIIAHIKKNNI